MSSVTLTPSQGSLVALLTKAGQTARSRSLTPVLDIGASWCEPCHMLNDLFASDDMRPAVKKMYLIHLDLDQWHDALDSLGVDVNTGIPRVQALNAKGLPSGEPWRPRDVPGGTVDAWPASLKGYFAGAQKLFAQASADEKKAGK